MLLRLQISWVQKIWEIAPIQYSCLSVILLQMEIWVQLVFIMQMESSILHLYWSHHIDTHNLLKLVHNFYHIHNTLRHSCVIGCYTLSDRLIVWVTEIFIHSKSFSIIGSFSVIRIFSITCSFSIIKSFSIIWNFSIIWISLLLTFFIVKLLLLLSYLV